MVVESCNNNWKTVLGTHDPGTMNENVMMTDH